MCAPSLWHGEQQGCVIGVACEHPECGAHFFDVFAIGQELANLVVCIYAEATTIAPPMPRQQLVLFSLWVPVDMAQVVFACTVVYKHLLQICIGVGVMGKQQYSRCIAVETMCRVERREVIVLREQTSECSSQMILSIPRGRVDIRTNRFVECNQPFVTVDDS